MVEVGAIVRKIENFDPWENAPRDISKEEFDRYFSDPSSSTSSSSTSSGSGSSTPTSTSSTETIKAPKVSDSSGETV